MKPCAGRSNTIKEYTIAVNVLNKPVSFKPQHDAIVRIHAGRLRRALNYYYKEPGTETKSKYLFQKEVMFLYFEASKACTESGLGEYQSAKGYSEWY